MPIIQTYQGQISLRGRGSGNDSSPFYYESIKAYGETIGELMDNLVQASIPLANNAFLWTMQNKPLDYSMRDDNWWLEISHPDLIESFVEDPSTHQKDTGGGSAVTCHRDIVTHTVIHRNVTIDLVATQLALTKSGPTQIPQHAAQPFTQEYYEDGHNYETYIAFGFTGLELDKILAIADEEGRLKKHRAVRVLARRLNEKRAVRNNRQSNLLAAGEKLFSRKK